MTGVAMFVWRRISHRFWNGKWGASMRNQTKVAWWRSAVPTVSWTLVCLLAMSLVFTVVAGA